MARYGSRKGFVRGDADKSVASLSREVGKLRSELKALMPIRALLRVASAPATRARVRRSPITRKVVRKRYW